MKFLIIFSLLLLTPFVCSSKIIINEICWMGTENSSSDEWIELRNLSSESIDLTNYTLEAEDGSPIIDLQGTIPANSYFLLERTDDSSVPGITADQIYTGALSNSGEYLKLKENNVVIDEINAVDGWPAGDNTSKQTMQLINTWQTGIATPKADNQATEQTTGTEQTTEIEQEQTTTTNNYTPIANAGNNI
ncbi:lamin tail domain-containing protein, partial [Patescibacteria group bacterium]|nr:lamin tail domain-containing protein [Patescibacteria group bacterium]